MAREVIVPTVPHVVIRPPTTNATQTPKVPASTVNAVADREPREVTLLATNSVIPATFGQNLMRPKPMVVSSDDTILYVAYLVNDVEIEGYINVYIDGVDINDPDEGFLLTTDAEIRYYTGTTPQSVDSWLSASISGFADDYEGHAYIILQCPVGSTSGFPRVEVEIQGSKVARLDPCTKLESTGASPTGVNLVPNSCDPANWDSNTATVTAETNTGIFTTGKVASTGATTDAAVQTIPGTGLGASILAGVTVYYQFGTSGKVQIRMDNPTAGEFRIEGTSVDNMGVVAQSGVFQSLLYESRAIGSYNVIRFFVWLFPPYSYSIAVGPNSSVVGEDAYVYGVQVEDSLDAQIGIGDPDQKVYTDNPVNVAAHMMRTKANWDVLAPSALQAAHWCNDIIEGQPDGRNTIGITYTKPIKLRTLIENLRAYTGCFIGWEDGGAKFVPYRELNESFYHTLDVDNILDFKIKKKQQRDIPTVVTVQYQDRGSEYKKVSVTKKAAGVDAGTTPRRLSRVNLIGCNNYNQANRDAIERLNTSLSDMACLLTVTDTGVVYQIGDLCQVTYPIGVTLDAIDKQMFITKLGQSRPGLWDVTVEEYQPELFSNVVESDPTFPDTNLPVHTIPPAVTGVTATEEVYKRRNGQWDNRLRIMWDASVSPYTQWYVVRVKEGGSSVLLSTQVADLELTFGPLEEGLQYTVEVAAVTSLYEGPAGYTTVTPLGKEIIPPDVQNFAGYEVGGEVRLSWSEVGDLDIIGYEIRYVTTEGGSWESAAVLDVVDALRYKTKELPPDDFDFLIKAKDSVGQFSENEARIRFTVTVDDNAYLAGIGVYADDNTADADVHRVTEVRGGSPVIYTDEDQDSWDTLFGSTALPTAFPLAYYIDTPDAGAFYWESDYYDLGLAVTGDFRQISNFTEYKGTATETMHIADDNAGSPGTWVEYTTFSQKLSDKRFGKMRVTGLGVARIDTGLQEYRVDAVSRSESNSTTSAASGATTINLTEAYSKVKSIVITPTFAGGAAVRTWVVDAVVVDGTTSCSFDVYFYDATDTQVAQFFYWSFEGI